MSWWMWAIVVLVMLWICGTILEWINGIIERYRDKNKICAWCNSNKIKFKSGKEGNRYWASQNKSGSKDRRVKDNFQLANFKSEYICNECSAVTKFNHYVSHNPSESVEVWKRKLAVKGQGERKGFQNWEGKIASIAKDYKQKG